MTDPTTESPARPRPKDNPFLDIKKVYVKDISFESPLVPGIFVQPSGDPAISVQIRVTHEALADQESMHEVILTITVTAQLEERTAMLIEVQQAGVFHLRNVTDEDRSAVLEVACPNVLLPFAREAISDLATRGGFPQLLINPVNFEMLYHRKQQARDTGGGNGSAAVAGGRD